MAIALVSVAAVGLAAAENPAGSAAVDTSGKKGDVTMREPMKQKNEWVGRNLMAASGTLPFSFRYGGQDSAALLPSWKRVATTEKLDATRTQHTVTWTDPATGLELRCIVVDYADYPAIEWTVYCKNTGTNKTPILENLRGLDALFQRGEGGEFVLHGNAGDGFDYQNIRDEGYKPFAVVLNPGQRKNLSPVGGRPTNGPDGWPYYNLCMPGGGMLLAVGWPGQWQTSFQRDSGKGLHITAGQQVTHLSLAPGEEVRSPLIALVFWGGSDVVESQNLWRRWMLAHNVPQVDGTTPAPILVASPDQALGLQDEAGCRKAIDTMDATGATVLWVDAGWYPCDPARKFQFLWWGTGDWTVDPVRFPSGFKPMSDALHAKGRRFLLWFDPERIGDPSCWVARTHPEWILNNVLLDLGNPQARRWITDQVDQLITTQGIDIYRQDFNVFPGPLDAWRHKDTPDRQGMAENLYVQGYLAFWDELRSRHPKLLIDSCASGGRRNDLETLRRSVPLYRTDTYEKGPATATASQGHTLGISAWVPFYGSGGHVTDSYTTRSFYMPSYTVWNFNQPSSASSGKAAPALADRARAEWAKVAPLMLGDFYPLTEWTLQDNQWLAWQFNRPEQGDGVIQVFRRPTCDESSITAHLRGLDPSAEYDLTNFDVAGTTRVSGKDLMEQGLAVEITAKPGAAVITYKKTTTPGSVPFVFSVEKKGEGNFFHGDYLDYPLSQVVVNGEVWSFHTTAAYKNPTPVIRYKGPDFEHLVRQPDGTLHSSEQGVSCHIGCGMWFDDATGTLYALIHSEYDGNITKPDKLWKQGAAWCRKKTRMAMSKDLGLTWSDPKDVLTACLPDPGDWVKYAGPDFEMGPADFDLYTDTRGGYFYVTCWNGFVAKKGPMNKFGTYTEVSRCAISDKMAPRKWYKFRDGTWTEPGLGGKASRVSQFPVGGRTIYNTYLKSYLRVGINDRVIDERFKAFGLVDASIYILTCTDLSKQDWSLPAKLLDEPGNIRFCFSLSDQGGKDFAACGKTFRIYNYWTKPPVRMFDVVLGEGTTPAIPCSRYGAYCYEPHPESGDATDSRKTQLAGCEQADMRYVGTGWKTETNEHYFQGRVKSSAVAGDSVEFPFKGGAIYWRAVFARDAGKVDVYVDQQHQETIDCFSGDPKQNMFQFGFIRTNLNSAASHTIKIVVRSDKNQNAVGTNIRHMGFEY